MIDFAQKPEYLDFANQILETDFPPDPLRTVWITRLNQQGEISAVVIYTNFTQHNCEMLIATDRASRWATREFMGVCYRYAFDQMKLRRVTVVVDVTNERSLRMCRKLGYVEEGRLKEWHGENDGIAMRMLRNECKWLEAKHG